MRNQSLNTAEFLALARNHTLMDVRSPSEYKQGHIPGAFSLPLFSDQERAIVGTLYKQQGREKALEKGLEIAGPKLPALIRKGRELSKGKPLFLYCWRGGMRSRSMAWLFNMDHIVTYTLTGGYKAYRHQVASDFESAIDLCVIGGYTGSGKTMLLEKLRDSGKQVINLESIAHHKGSAFGGLAGQEQPSTEHFANLLHAEIKQLDKNYPVWTEDESRMIGKVRIPDAFYKQLRTAKLFVILLPKEVRLKRLIHEYGHSPKETLEKAFESIRKKIGGQHYQTAINSLYTERLEEAASIALNYYDKAYKNGLNHKENKKVFFLEFDTFEPDKMLQKLTELWQRNRYDSPPTAMVRDVDAK